MKYMPDIAAGLLGFAFLVFGADHFLDFIPKSPPEMPPAAIQFFTALSSTGYLHLVKILEIVGAIFIILPRTRNAGLLVLGPIMVNILAFHIFIMEGATLLEPVLLVLTALTAFVLWTRRADFNRLLGCCGRKQS